MPNAGWQQEIKNAAAKWPRGFRACLDTGVWQLLGASEDVQQEFGRWAQCLHLELRFPSGDTDAATALLYRLKENGHYVRSTLKLQKRQAGSMKLESRRQRATICPLGSALIKYVIDGPVEHPKAKSKSGMPPPDSGQAAAAHENRVRGTRLSILAALRVLGQPYAEWPSFVREFNERLEQYPEYRQSVSPAPFQPPDFDRLNQSPADWIKAADKSWKLHRDTFLSGCQYWARVGVDDEIRAGKRTRGTAPGTGGGKRGANTVIQQRYAWAAQYLSRVPLKEIAAQSHAHPTTVGRISREILRQAEWLRGRRPRGAA